MPSALRRARARARRLEHAARPRAPELLKERDLYPIDRSNDRLDLPPDYAGPIDVWDVDKTYLDTDFESLRGLARTLLEGAADKRAVRGVVPILKGLRRGAKPGEARPPLYFISASPPEMRRVLERKMLFDGLEPDGIAFKDVLALARRRRFREMTRHVGYKVAALLSYRREWPPAAREWLYGDDAETDALAYALYADLRAGRLRGAALARALASAGVPEKAGSRLVAAAGDLPSVDSVARIFILRTGARPAVDLAEIAARSSPLVVVEDAVDLAKRLAAEGRVPAGTVEAVAAEVGSSPPSEGRPAESVEGK